jgi:hypothetical protein
LINDEIEICFDDITSEQLGTLPRILKSLKLKKIKFWSASFEQSEFSKYGIRKGKSRKDPKTNTESSAIMSKQITPISESLEKSQTLLEFGLYGIILTQKTWSCLGKGLESSQIRTLALQKCEISEKEFEGLFQHIGSMTGLINLDLSNNKLKGTCGYFLGRIISRQGERRDTNKWENELRGSTAEIPLGLKELYISNNCVGDYGWDKIMSSLVSDNWLRLIEAKNNNLTSASFDPTNDALDQNKSLLVLDLRENPNFDSYYMKILEIVDRNFDYLDRSSEDNDRYTQLFENICNEEPLPGICDIKIIAQAKMKNSPKVSQQKISNQESMEKINSVPYINKINKECEVLREENARLKKKLGKSGKKRKRRTMISTQNIMQLAEKKLAEANEMLELVENF